MTDRSYRFLFGLVLLASLYFDLYGAIAAIVAFSLFEGVTNLRLPILVSKVTNREMVVAQGGSGAGLALEPTPRIAFDAERAWRLVVAVFLILTVFVYPDQLWFIPWFMGFAILGAGLSGVCPMLITLKFMGFR